MKTSEYQVIQNFLRQSCGVVLGENKQYLVVNRLTSLLARFNLASFSDLVACLQANNLSSKNR